ncbi:hypothetical protein AB0B85_32820 [Micromonospora sp. NPDC049044]|uniref:hypothetical protein n=1 Tax=Micromonospora sp. NPDC049044 TaxID=3154827 RepID=UPI0033C17943
MTEQKDSWIAALEEERRGYEVRGLDERVKEVNAAIRAHEMKKNGKPEGRTVTNPRKQTATAARKTTT